MAFTAIPKQNSWIGHFWVPKSLTFKMRPSAQPFLWKWVLFAWELKIISTSKAEHSTSFWYRGPGELRNALFLINWTEEMQEYAKYVCSEVKEIIRDTLYNESWLVNLEWSIDQLLAWQEPEIWSLWCKQTCKNVHRVKQIVRCVFRLEKRKSY